jgi:hypothetical protein
MCHTPNQPPMHILRSYPDKPLILSYIVRKIKVWNYLRNTSQFDKRPRPYNSYTPIFYCIAMRKMIVSHHIVACVHNPLPFDSSKSSQSQSDKGIDNRARYLSTPETR